VVSVTSTTAVDRPATVDGQDALVVDGIYVRWNEPSGTRVAVWCLPRYDGMVDLAESLPPGGG
jgi:hypothetical protein